MGTREPTFPLFQAKQTTWKKLTRFFKETTSQVVFAEERPNLRAFAKLLTRAVVLFFRFLYVGSH